MLSEIKPTSRHNLCVFFPHPLCTEHLLGKWSNPQKYQEGDSESGKIEKGAFKPVSSYNLTTTPVPSIPQQEW
jgi:hypothetical protein